MAMPRREQAHLHMSKRCYQQHAPRCSAPAGPLPQQRPAQQRADGWVEEHEGEGVGQRDPEGRLCVGGGEGEYTIECLSRSAHALGETNERNEQALRSRPTPKTAHAASPVQRRIKQCHGAGAGEAAQRQQRGGGTAAGERQAACRGAAGNDRERRADGNDQKDGYLGLQLMDQFHERGCPTEAEGGAEDAREAVVNPKVAQSGGGEAERAGGGSREAAAATGSSRIMLRMVMRRFRGPLNV